MCRKIEKVNVMGAGEVKKCMSTVISIMSRCEDRIKYCGTHVVIFSDGEEFEAPSPLKLPKAPCVDIGDVVFYRIWTNECRRLKLFNVDNISKDWCKFVIANCDCSNITSLILSNVKFEANSINEMVLKQWALKFYNLKTLEIKFFEKVDDP